MKQEASALQGEVGHAYVDEAGDEGFGKLKTERCGGQSHWLALGAILVSEANDRNLPKWRDSALDVLANKKRDIHFNKLKHEQKVAISRLFAKNQFGISVICSDKIEITKLSDHLYKKYKEKGHLYNYLTRFLLERLTAACAKKAHKSGTKAKLEITFSRRAGTDYSVMRDYLYLMRDGKEKLEPTRSIDWTVFNPKDVTYLALKGGGFLLHWPLRAMCSSYAGLHRQRRIAHPSCENDRTSA